MGPFDPFDTQAQAAPVSRQSEPEETLRASAASAPTAALATGALVGGGVGALSLFVSWGELLEVAAWSAAGALIAWLVAGVLTGRLDVRAAWHALHAPRG